ncbi:MAG: hypothetical protein FJW64_11120 [Actinobacteria bacterium]|nr:hypothetical protein [Actinomycetota bacterium]
MADDSDPHIRTKGEYPPQLQAIVERIEPGWWPKIEVGKGWWPLLERLDQRLAQIDPAYVARRVRADNGHLRFEVTPGTHGVSLHALKGAVNEAAAEAARTCEQCGREVSTTTLHPRRVESYARNSPVH